MIPKAPYVNSTLAGSFIIVLLLFLATMVPAADVNLLLECPEEPSFDREALIEACRAAITERGHYCYLELKVDEVVLLEPEYALLVYIKPIGDGWLLVPELQHYAGGNIQSLSDPPGFAFFVDLLVGIDFYCGALLDTIEIEEPTDTSPLMSDEPSP